MAIIDPMAVEARLQEELVRNRLLSQALVSVGKSVSSLGDPRAVFHHALDEAIRVAGASGGDILLRQPDGSLVSRAHRAALNDLRSIAHLRVSRRMAALALEHHRPVHYGVRDRESHAEIALPPPESETLSAICVPIESRAQAPYGAVVLEGRRGTPFFGPDGADFMEGLASQLTIALENARLVERSEQEQRQREKLSRYFSEAVMADIIAEKTSPTMGGESRIVTILFSDLRGSTSLLERLKPTEAVEMLNEYFTEIVDEILAEDGTLDKFTGDGIMALWNAPRSQPDHALRAIRAAVRVQSRLPALRMRWRDERRSFASLTDDLVAGIGIHTGEVVVGNIGSPKRMEYTAIGDAVNLAARIQGVSPGGDVLITTATLQAAGESVFAEALPPVAVKGKSEKVSIHRVLGVV